MADSVLPEVVDAVPQNVLNAIDGILNDVYGREVRQDIVTALTWKVDYINQVARFINDLGLIVKDGKLCVIFNGQ